MTRNRSAGASGGQGGSPDHAADAVAAEFAALRRSVNALEQGLTQMLDATATHTEMLRALLAAATAPVEPDAELPILLKAVVARLVEQGTQLHALNHTMTKLPEDVGSAVVSQMAGALASIR
jgi:hypothetical protein